MFFPISECLIGLDAFWSEQQRSCPLPDPLPLGERETLSSLAQLMQPTVGGFEVSLSVRH